MSNTEKKSTKKKKVVVVGDASAGKEAAKKASRQVKEKKKEFEKFHLEIDCNQKEDNTWAAKWQDEKILWEGLGVTPLDSIRNLINNVELEGIKDEKKKYNRYLSLHFDNAKALVLQIADILGPQFANDWFTVYQIKVKTGADKNQILGQLNLLRTYGLVECETKKKDPNGHSRWRIIRTKQLQKKELEDRKAVYEMEINQIDYQLENLLLNEEKQQPGK